MPKNDRVPELDILRFIAIFLVLFRHVIIIPGDLYAPVKAVFLQCREFGWIGVDLFFVLSGFLVSGLLFREYRRHNAIRPFAFLFRRAMKLYPAFYAFVLLSVLMIRQFGIDLFGIGLQTPERLLGEVLFLQNYLATAWPHTWSLAVEEHFYLLLVLGLSFLPGVSRGKADPFRVLPYLCLVICGGMTLARVAAVYQYSFTWQQVLLMSHFRLDSLLFGVFLSYEYHFNHEKTVRLFRNNLPVILACCAAMLLPVMALRVGSGFVYSVGLTLLYVGFGGLMMSLITWQGRHRQAVLEKLSFFAFLGRHSYSVYLWHFFVYVLSVIAVRELWHRDVFFWEMLFYFTGTFLAGVGMSVLIEQPFLRLRDRFLPSKSGSFSGAVPVASVPAPRLQTLPETSG